MDISLFLNDTIKESGEVKTLSPRRKITDVVSKIAEMQDNSTEIAITFIPELEQRFNETTLKEITEKTVRRALRTAPKEAQLILIGEHSPLGRWHYHGLFRHLSNDIVSKLKRSCRRQLGRTEIKMITYPESYAAYIMKSYTNTLKTEYPERWISEQHIFINWDASNDNEKLKPYKK